MIGAVFISFLANVLLYCSLCLLLSLVCAFYCVYFYQLFIDAFSVCF